MTTEFLALLSAPLLIAGVVGAWTAAARLYIHRVANGAPATQPPPLPDWLAWVAALLALLAGLVLVASQLIASMDFTQEAEHQAAAVLVVLMSPVWVISAFQAAFAVALHYVLDDLLIGLRLDATLHEGIARGVRAAWAALGLLTLFFGLQLAVPAATTLQVVEARTLSQIFFGLAGVGFTLAALLLPGWVEARAAALTAAGMPPASPPPPSPDRPNESGSPPTR